jgi:hypothetical protein
MVLVASQQYGPSPDGTYVDFNQPTNQPTRVLDAAELTSCNDDAVDVGLQWVHHIGSSCFMDH